MSISLSRRLALLGAAGAGSLLGREAKADTAFTSFAFPDSAPSSTTSRTDPARWGDVINVLSYGADPNNNVGAATATTAAIQAAINAGGPLSATIFFPDGTYFINAALVPPTSGSVDLRGGSATIKGNFADFLIKNNPSGVGQPTIYGIDNFTLWNQYADPANGFNVNIGGIYTINTINGYITNCNFIGCWNFIVYGSANMFDCLIQNCKGNLPGIGTLNGGGPIGLMGGASTTILDTAFLSGYCGFMIGGGVGATAAGGMTRMFGTRSESNSIGVFAGANVNSSGVLGATACAGFVLIGHQSERCTIGLNCRSISAAHISGCIFTGTIGPVVSANLSWTWSAAAGGTAVCTFVGPTLDSNGWTTGQTKQVFIEAVSGSPPAGYVTYPASVAATYVTANSFSFPAVGPLTTPATGGRWSFPQISGIVVSNMSETVISGTLVSSGVLSLNNAPTPAIDLFNPNATGKGTFDGHNNLLIGVIGNSWAMPPTLIQASSSNSQKAGTQYIMCNNPAGSTTDVYGNVSGMVFAELPGGTNISLGSPVDGMQYDIIDARKVGNVPLTGVLGEQVIGGGTQHALVRYNGTNWTCSGL